MISTKKSKTVCMGIVTWALMNDPAASHADTSCPSAEDIAYSTQVGETWYSLGGRAYCLDGPGDRSRAAIALYEYNRGRVGPSASDLAEGVVVCLPKYLHGSFFDATRCRSAPVAEVPSPPANPPMAAEKPVVKSECGNAVRDEGEWCDGADLAGNTCGSLGLPAGVLRCRADCRGVDASGCGPKSVTVDPEPKSAPEVVKRQDEPRNLTRFSIAVEATGGLLVPLAEKPRMVLYGPIGLARIGTRFTLGWSDVAVHGYVGGNQETTSMDPVEQFRSTVLGGGGLQIGVPIATGSFRVTPGIEVLQLLAKQTLEMPEEFNRTPVVSAISMTLFGVYLRPEYQFKRIPRLRAALELAFDYVPQRIEALPRIDNFQMKALGGLSYVAF